MHACQHSMALKARRSKPEMCSCIGYTHHETQVYTQGLHRREFEVGYTHRRERALKEGEDASIELARQMEAQVWCVGNKWRPLSVVAE